MNWLDKVISFVSPNRGASRARSRRIEKILSSPSRRGYDGASAGHRTGGWRAASTSANTEIQGALFNLRNRARDLVRNDPYAARAVQAFSGNLIGPGIVPKCTHKTDSRAKAAQALWKQWAETTACDFYGHQNIYGLQAQAARALFESGEVIVRRLRLPASIQNPVPLQIQILEADYLDSNRNNLTTAEGGWILQGVEYDKTARIVAYWLFKRHPGDIGLPLGGLVSERVLASEIQHVYRPDRPGQNRGATWFAPILLKLRDFNDYEDTQLMRQKIAACFAVFTMDAEPAMEPQESPASEEGNRVEPGLIMNLPPGRDVKFGNPPGVDGYGDYSKNVLRGIAAGLNMPYEILTGDLSNVNFSSGRMGWLEFHRNLQQWTWSLFVPQFCDPIWEWFISAAMLVNPKTEDVEVEWTPPRREMINPADEVKAAIAAIRAGVKTRSEFIRSQGDDPDQIDAELAADNQRADQLGLILDSDPRKLTQVGMFQVTQSAPEAAPKEGAA